MQLADYNAAQHIARLIKQKHKSNGMTRMIWPANSPDFNPSENVWRMREHRVAKRSPHTMTDLRQYIEEEWAGMSGVDFAKYMDIEERYQAMTEAKRCHTKW